jgi:hypothetical protein
MYSVYIIHKRIYGVLTGLWKPFQIIFIGLIPFTIFHLILAVESFFNILLIPDGLFKHIIEHFLIVFTFIMIGYAFVSIEKTLGEYGVLVSKINKIEERRRDSDTKKVDKRSSGIFRRMFNK